MCGSNKDLDRRYLQLALTVIKTSDQKPFALQTILYKFHIFISFTPETVYVFDAYRLDIVTSIHTYE